jgi:aminopeptidase N
MGHSRAFWSVAVAAVLCCLGHSQSPVLGQRGLRQPPAAQPAPAAGSQPPAAVEPLRTASDRPIDIKNIRLDLRVDLPGKAVDGKATLDFRTVRPTRSVRLDATGFEVKQVLLTGGNEPAAPARHTYDGDKLVVDLGARWPAGHAGTLQVHYRVQKPKDGLHFFAPSETEPDVPQLLWSHGEPVTNRYWIPCIDEPDQRQTTEVVATVPEGFEVVSNGKLIERRQNAADKTVTFDWRQDIPHPSYLVTLVVGQFDVVQEEWEGLPVVYYVPRGHRPEALPTYGRTRDMLTFFSQRFGIHYPWDKYAQVTAYQFGGGMEHTSATTMGDRILVDQRALLDRTAESIVSHELAHQWWGDMVTCRDWSHLWLNEGFASYAEALWDEHSKGADDYAYNMYRKASGAISGGKTRPVMDRHYSSPGAMFDGRSYPKGAWVLHMLRHRLGEEAFWKGIQRYGTDYKFQSAETGDFRRSMERTTGRDMERFFYDWLERAGNPDVEVATEYVPDAQVARVVVKQTQAGEPFHFPVKLVLHSSGSTQPTVLEEEMTDKELNLRIPVPGLLTRVDVDPDQAVLSEIKETKSHDLWRAQLLGAPSVPARLRATHHFAQSKNDEDRALVARAFAQERFWAVRIELAAALGNMGGTVCRDAVLQGLQQSDARVRRACMEALGKFAKDATVVAVLKETLHKGDPSYAVEGAALAAYAKTGQGDAIALITPWLTKPSHQDTLAASALTALGATESPTVLDTLVSWSQPGKPGNCRMAARRSLAQLARTGKLTEPQRQRVVKVVVAALEADDRFSRLGMLMALSDMGPVASAALPALEKILREGPEGRLKEMAKRVADRLRAEQSTAPAVASKELSQLREVVKRLEREQEELRKRLDRYERGRAVGDVKPGVAPSVVPAAKANP